MQVQSLLSRLPELWRIDILLQWLTDERRYDYSLNDFGRLDIAYCSLSGRPAWLKLLSLEPFVVGGVRLKSCIVEWLSSRGVKMNTIDISTDRIASKVSTMNLSKVHTILYVDLHHMYQAHEQASFQEILHLLLSQCHALTTLRITERDSSFCRFSEALFYSLSDQQLRQLNFLTLTRSYCDSEVLSRVTDLCESLETLSIRENLSKLFTPDVLMKCMNKFRRLKRVNIDCCLSVEVINAMTTCLPLLEGLVFSERTDFSLDEPKEALMNLFRKAPFLTGGRFYIGLFPFSFSTNKRKGSCNWFLTITYEAQHYEWFAFVFSLDHIISEVTGLLLDIPLSDWCLQQIAHSVPNIRYIQLCNDYDDFTVDGLRTFLSKCTQLVDILYTACHHLPVIELIKVLFSSSTLTHIHFSHQDFRPRMMNNMKLSASLVSVSITRGGCDGSFDYKKGDQDSELSSEGDDI